MRNKLATVLLLGAMAPASAHVMLAEPNARPGSDYVAHIKLGHGCSGSPTIAFRLAIPAGVTAVKVADKPGWAITVAREAVTWKGGPAAGAENFTLSMHLPAGAQILAFPAQQTCVSGSENWSDVPAKGEKALHPAPLLTLADAPAAPPSNLAVSDAWIRALPAGLPAGGYFTLHNGGAGDVILTGADSPACGMLMLHKSDNSSGMSHMADMAQVTVPAGGSVRFAPGGYHLMCEQPGTAIRPGASVPVTLSFQGGGTLAAQFAVRNATGK